MRYIKKFNENKNLLLDLDKLKDFCETHLAYLMDKDYVLYITDVSFFNGSVLSQRFGGKYIISLNLDPDDTDSDDSSEFRWDDIKDHFIPFLTHLNNKYNVEEVQIIKFDVDDSDQSKVFYSFEEILNDKPSELECSLYEVDITISL
jgi:hypothetical protein